MNDIVLRRAGSGDLPALLPLIAEFCGADGHPFDEDRVRRALAPLLADDALGVVWLIDDPPAGYGILTWSYSLESGGRDALLDELYLRDRGRGRGSAALQGMLADLRRRGITRIFLETEAPNRQARRFYARNGFVVEDSIWMSADV
jgi:GNAT superfamily N-acetyltransferase